ncbi:MAG: 4-(cytidine 5'-diphospho)-2-C-methyl-D-erythritol kinase [Lachnospiraceae bacterium]|nr:4-(cytidine 5'-diphospho)-2-C-methyl-D-erythritol kinase [Lachnospiraceae bacterium]
MDSITKTYKAYAKVNLALDVLRKRPDGYHDVKMVMQNIDIYDELEFTVTDIKKAVAHAKPCYNIMIETNKLELPTDESNLIHKAIRLMFDEYNICGDVLVKLTKNIPIEAGMAGGSTDCAAALKAVNDIFEIHASLEELMRLGKRLGADVPFCLLGKTALAEGIGEILTEVQELPSCTVLVVKPPVGISTGMIYGNMNCDELKSRPDIDGMLEGLRKHDLGIVVSKMENVMETVTARLCPDIEDIKNAMKEKGALNAIMSGSGPTVFGIFDDSEKAWEAADYIGELDLATDIFVTKPV